MRPPKTLLQKDNIHASGGPLLRTIIYQACLPQNSRTVPEHREVGVCDRNEAPYNARWPRPVRDFHHCFFYFHLRGSSRRNFPYSTLNRDMNKLVNFVIAVAIAIVTFSIWAMINQPAQEPVWPDRVQGFAFSPYRIDQNPNQKIYPTVAQIDEDLKLLAGRTHAIRTYSVEDVMAEIPQLARRHGINVSLGAWLSNDMARNEFEVDKAIEVAARNHNVVRLTIGNEVLLRGELTVEQVSGYLDRARTALWQPVSVAEPWHIWLKHPELVEHVDYLAVHILPYWEGQPVEAAVDFVVQRMNELKAKYPDKPIVLSEVGWPSRGRVREAAVASDANEGIFLRQFLARAKKEKYVYYIMEAFDQPWKAEFEGAVGAYWGVYDVERKPKFPFAEPIVNIPEWRMLAGISVLIAAITLSILLIDSETLRSHGRSFLAIIAYAAATSAVWVIHDYVNQYLTLGTITIGILLVMGMIGVIVVLLTEAHEWAEAVWAKRLRRPFTPVRLPDEKLPKVSIHVPCYNEPPDMMIETLNALAQLDYPNYEVLVIDNNTKDPTVWQPVQAHCEKLGPRFRFFHVDPLAGFKAGALNHILKHTASDATIIAAIDSDYMVDPNWLRDLAPQFANPKIAIVQAPQDYRDESENAFKAMCYAEYKGFFYIGMITRNERNAIIQHGTMTMVRRSVLEEIGGWGEWTITEDAELGLRIFEQGYEAVYIPKSYGKGLMPDTFIDFKKQRHRWAYGAMQILRGHLGQLFGLKKSKLANGQRYHFIAGWLPWIADGLNLFFTAGSIAWSIAMIYAPDKVDPPLMVFALLPLTLFCFKVVKLLYLYQARVDVTVRQTLAAAVAGLALSHSIAKAILQGLVIRSTPFFRTPKMENAAALHKALASAREEFGLALVLWLCVGGLAMLAIPGSRDLHLWMTALVVQSLPYVAAVIMALISAFPRLPAGLVTRVQPT